MVDKTCEERCLSPCALCLFAHSENAHLNSDVIKKAQLMLRLLC